MREILVYYNHEQDRIVSYPVSFKKEGKFYASVSADADFGYCHGTGVCGAALYGS